MKIEKRTTKKDNIVQITTLDERWYECPDNKDVIYRPSSSWIAGYYPKGIAFYKWLAEKGWDESQALKNAAGNRGSKVHQAIEILMNGNTVHMSDQFTNHETGLIEETSVEEWECIMSFVEWFKETKPEIIAFEQVIENKEVNYAGTMDLKCKIDGEVWVVDFKTSAYIWAEHKLQLSSYKHADGNEDVVKQGILQLNYKLNKKKFKFTEIDDKFDLFLSAYKIWEEENKDVQPKQKDYPTELSINQ